VSVALSKRRPSAERPARSAFVRKAK
jgi:hypothetical protein